MSELLGCTNHGCYLRDNTKGMATNSICTCLREIERTAQGRLALIRIQQLQQRIAELEKENTELRLKLSAGIDTEWLEAGND